MQRFSFEEVRRILGNNFSDIFNISQSDIINIGPYPDVDGVDENERRRDHRCGSLADVASDYAENYHIYCAIGVCVFGTVSNSLNVAVLTRKEMASVPINRILTALAVADMLLMVEYISFHSYYYQDVSGRRDFPYLGAVFALFHIHFSQVMHTTSICLTLTLAIWRYLALGYPEKTHVLGSDKRCSLAIVLSFVIPIILCSPTFLSFHIKSNVIKEDKNYTLYTAAIVDELRENEFLLKANFWMYGVFIKLLPCCILSVISCWLVKTLMKAKKRKQILRSYETHPLRVEGKTCDAKPTKAERRADRTTKMLIAVLLLFLVTEFPQGIFALYIALKGEYFFLVCYQKYGAVMDILALNNGSVNFILYCYMNRMFRSTFGQLFKQRLLSKLKVDNPNSEVQSTLV
ncbi:G-protein coupled receptor dmsr-1 [Coccinella septempunctata]|uniref:G-protein coupled receptor dmsr-1 n=1 Tax=Coccinella septempunctata TaxID=41139 RepID=UPI001D06D97B|nr:G-protein coupled receptor dmsr-1 [Coccinella septempunctata]